MKEKREQKVWMVRAGKGASVIDDFFNNDIIAIGWNELGKIPKNMEFENLRELIAKTYPDFSKGKVSQVLSQVWHFYKIFKPGDFVVTYDPSERAYYVGTIKSPYHHSTTYIFHHFRNVEWEIGPYFRDELTPESKNVLGSIRTIFEIPQQVFEDLETAHPAYTPEEDFDEMIEMHEQFQKEEEERIAKEIVSKSTDFIEDQILKLDWEEVEVLVAGILRAMGYKTRMTGKGSDLGSDIIASPDGLEMVEPIIKVEVKHKVKSKEKVGAPDIRNFVGGLRNSTKGIYVSTTGFSKEAQYEAERANFHITLMDLDLLVELLVENYESLNPEIKALVPLKRIYWPV